MMTGSYGPRGGCLALQGLLIREAGLGCLAFSKGEVNTRLLDQRSRVHQVLLGGRSRAPSPGWSKFSEGSCRPNRLASWGVGGLTLSCVNTLECCP